MSLWVSLLICHEQSFGWKWNIGQMKAHRRKKTEPLRCIKHAKLDKLHYLNEDLCQYAKHKCSKNYMWFLAADTQQFVSSRRSVWLPGPQQISPILWTPNNIFLSPNSHIHAVHMWKCRNKTSSHISKKTQQYYFHHLEQNNFKINIKITNAVRVQNAFQK